MSSPPKREEQTISRNGCPMDTVAPLVRTVIAAFELGEQHALHAPGTKSGAADEFVASLGRNLVDALTNATSTSGHARVLTQLVLPSLVVPTTTFVRSVHGLSAGQRQVIRAFLLYVISNDLVPDHLQGAVLYSLDAFWEDPTNEALFEMLPPEPQSSVVEAIRLAFAAVDLPGRDDVIAEEVPETQMLRSCLASKHWSELVSEYLENQRGSVLVQFAGAFRHYCGATARIVMLPAYLTASLLEHDPNGEASVTVLSALDAHLGFRPERVSDLMLRLDQAQISAVRRYLQFMTAEHLRTLPDEWSEGNLDPYFDASRSARRALRLVHDFSAQVSGC